MNAVAGRGHVRTFLCLLLASAILGCGPSREYQACVKHRPCVFPNYSKEQAEQVCSDSEYINCYRECADCVLSHPCENYTCTDAGRCSGQMPDCHCLGPP